jgi:hypothetical protein
MPRPTIYDLPVPRIAALKVGERTVFTPNDDTLAALYSPERAPSANISMRARLKRAMPKRRFSILFTSAHPVLRNRYGEDKLVVTRTA